MSPPEFNSVIPSVSLLVEKRCQILQESLIQYLSSLAAKLDELEQNERFPFKTQKQLISDPAFGGSIAALYDGSSINEILHPLIQDVNAHAIDLISTLTDIESFINLKIPKCETGNNFGVEVQELVIKLAREKREKIQGIVDSLGEYYLKRGEAIAKFGTESVSETESYTCDEANKLSDPEKKEENKSLSKESKKTINRSLRANKDYEEHARMYDVKWYFKLKGFYREIVMGHLATADLITKNIDKILDPRNLKGGANGRGGSEGMMMY